MISKVVEKKKKNSPYLWIIIALILGVFIIWFVSRTYSNSIWSKYINTLKLTPGIVVIDSGRVGSKFFVNGLNDPIAEDPKIILKRTKINPRNVESSWQQFISLDKNLILKKADKLLNTPEHVNLKFENGVIIATGISDSYWLEEAKNINFDIPGVSEIDLSHVFVTEIKKLQKN